MEIYCGTASIFDVNSISNCNENCLPLSYSPIEYIFYILSPFHEVFTLKKDNEVIGYAVGNYNDNNFHIMSIGVLDKFRGNGYGNKLMSCIITHIKKYVENISLYVNAGNTVAINFYQKHGFKIVGDLKNYYKAVPGKINKNGYLMTRIVTQ